MPADSSWKEEVMRRTLLHQYRSEVVFGSTLVVVAPRSALGMAGSIGNDTVTGDARHPGGLLDRRHDDRPPRQAVTKIDFYAATIKPMAFMVVSFVPELHGQVRQRDIHAATTGVQFVTPPASSMVSTGDDIGMYFEQDGVVPFTSAG